MSIKIGSPQSLSAKPLTRWFSHTDAGKASGLEVVFAAPVELAAMLAGGEIAAALASSIEYFRTPGYAAAPGISLSGLDESESVRAFAKVPWRKIESLALDRTAPTCAALLKILLSEQLDSYPAFLNTAPDLASMLAQADACLLTGDPGLRADGSGLNVLDLGRAWLRLTGLPFVYALWLGKPEALTPQVLEALQAAKAWGLTQLDAIAEEEAPRLGISVRRCRHYLTEVINYDLGEEHLQGLETFGAKAYTQRLFAAPPTPIRLV